MCGCAVCAAYNRGGRTSVAGSANATARQRRDPASRSWGTGAGRRCSQPDRRTWFCPRDDGRFRGQGHGYPGSFDLQPAATVHRRPDPSRTSPSRYDSDGPGRTDHDGRSASSGADAVLPAEKVEIDGARVLALDEVSPGKHVGLPGEDIAAASLVLPSGRRLRPQDLGVLSSIGMAQVPVVRRPIVRIAVTGNELLPAGTLPHDYHIADANGPMLNQLVQRDGGIPVNPGIVPDQADAILAAIQHEADVIIVSGGSSVGQEDLAPALLAEHGHLAIHGIAMRPSSPTGMGTLG